MARDNEFASSVNDRGRGRDGDRGRRREDYESSYTGTAKQLEYPRQSRQSEYSTQAPTSSAASARRTSSQKPQLSTASARRASSQRPPLSAAGARRAPSQKPPVSLYGGSRAGGFADPSAPASEVGTIASIDGGMHKSVSVVGREIETADKLKGRRDDTEARELAVEEDRERLARRQGVLSDAQRHKRINDFSQSTLDRTAFAGQQSSRAPTIVTESSNASRGTEEGRSGRPRGQSTASKSRRPYQESEPVLMTASIQHRSRRLTMEHSSRGDTTVSYEHRHHSTQIYTSSHGRKDERDSSSSSIHPRAIKASVSGVSQSRNQPTSITGRSTRAPSVSRGSISGESSARSRALEFRPKDSRYDDSQSSASASTLRPGTVIRDRLPNNFPEFPNSESGAKTIYSNSNASSLRKPAGSLAGTDLRSQYSGRREGSHTGSVLNPISAAGSSRHSRPPTAYRDYPSSATRSLSQAGSRRSRDPYDDR
ncbi:6387aa06-d7ca-4ed0-9aeb-7e84031b41c4 [Sclerotinia trifoliorum]|uniref:6387aa06-d7ca-4ed0-9aeb-7e84031b41c4 n=1 Tax=Sclerotinia trifoliorum TaxID=28548 RepID=A0A8H2VZN4_9HELO|nr:6387aa06-d7ca-4ed0-9aeb-7e84031b41c4 [Sclerotinia trifoliorum]